MLGQAEVGAGDGEGYKAVFVGVLVGFGEAFGGPVGAAEGVDPSGGVELVERFDDGADGGVGSSGGGSSGGVEQG